MYNDNPPPYAPESCPQTVLVLEAADFPCIIEDVIEAAQGLEATTVDADGDKLFWIVFESEPRRVWDMTERVFRDDLTIRNMSKAAQQASS